jgi:peptidoglycan/xylan/chitin deacetylase (PgdA/CDA1 family)
MDRVQQILISSNTGAVRDGAAKWRIGNYAGYYLNGSTAYPVIYNRALTQSEIDQNFYDTVGYFYPNYNNSGGVCLTFDDHFVDNWYAQRGVFQTNNVNATFFISAPNTLTAAEIVKLNTLEDDGHEIASHGYAHLNAVNYLTTHTNDQYIIAEIYPSINMLRAQGYEYPSTFSYPGSSRNLATDELLNGYFTMLRWWTDTPSEAMITYNSTHLVQAFELDNMQHYNDYQYYDILQQCKRENKILVLMSHDIQAGNYADEYVTAAERLNNLTTYAHDNNISFYTFQDLTASEDNLNPFTVTASQTTVQESETQITLTVAASKIALFNNSVNISAIDNSAINGVDYEFTQQTITIPAGSLSASVVLSIKDNADNKPPKSFTVALSNPTGNATLGDPSSVEITIVNQFIGASDEPGTIGVLISFIAAILGIFPAIVDLIVSAGVLAVVTILAGVLFTFIAKLKLGW